VDHGIREVADDDEDAIVALSLRACEPVYQSVEQVLGAELTRSCTARTGRSTKRIKVRRVLRREDMHTLVADVDGGVIGFVCAVAVDLQRRIGEVVMVAVDPTAQRRGVGTALTLAATEWLRQKGMAVAFISTGGDPGHSAARGLYATMGYTPSPSMQYFMSLCARPRIGK
jgi:GNAT superfamily N-acetyltransferase